MTMNNKNEKLADMKVADFINVLASDAPAPGGGAAAALVGATGAALTSMVANLTLGNKKYAEHDSLMKNLLAENDKLHRRFIELMEQDAEVFNGVSAVFAMPKDTDEQKSVRSSALQEALKKCVIPPFEMMVCASDALELFEDKLDKFNTNATSDLGVAALGLKAAMQGAWLNILINISLIKDDQFATKYRKDGEALLVKSLPVADRIYEAVCSKY